MRGAPAGPGVSLVTAGSDPSTGAVRAVAAGFGLRPSRARRAALALLPLVLLAAANPGSGAASRHPQDLVPVKELAVPGNAGWVDTGIDVEEDQEFFFLCDGEISLQRGNPEAACGPEGTDIQGLQQPVPDHNLGCFVGKVGMVMSVRTDEKTKEEIKEELARTFFIGRSRTVVMPMAGRLSLGVNENVVKDNDGEFRVLIFRKAA